MGPVVRVGGERPRREDAAQTLTGDDLLLRSTFHLSSGCAEAGEPAFTTWGRVSMSGLETEVDDVTMDGDVTTGLIGFDAEWERVLAGVMVSQSAGEGDYRLSAENGGDAGRAESSLTGVYPYARLALTGRMTGRSEAAVTGCLSESVIKAHAPRVKSRRAVAQPWRKFQRQATEPANVSRTPAVSYIVLAALVTPVRFSTPVAATPLTRAWFAAITKESGQPATKVAGRFPSPPLARRS